MALALAITLAFAAFTCAAHVRSDPWLSIGVASLAALVLSLVIFIAGWARRRREKGERRAAAQAVELASVSLGESRGVSGDNH